MTHKHMSHTLTNFPVHNKGNASTRSFANNCKIAPNKRFPTEHGDFNHSTADFGKLFGRDIPAPRVN